MADNATGVGTNPIWWGLTVAIVIIAGAASFRLVQSRGGFEFSGTSEGFKLVADAQISVSSARSELDELRAQINAKDESLKKVAADLTARENEIQRLLAQLEQASKTAAASPAAQSVSQSLARLRATPATTVAQTPKVDWSRYDAASRNLSAADTALQKATAKR